MVGSGPGSKSVLPVLLFAVVFSLSALAAESTSIESFFTGKEVVLKINMPGSQKGVDLRFNKPAPMDWKEYGSRVKQFGTAIPKGATSRVTSVVVKKDMIEFQLDGGGFGTFGDDTQTKVDSKVVEKTDYEKSLEDQISKTDDPDRKAQLQRDLDREQAKRQKQQAANDRTAQVASQMKAQKVADNRAGGGSRFNLRWSGSIPPDQLNPDAIMKLLAEYVDFSPIQGANAAPAAKADEAKQLDSAAAGGGDGGSPTSQLKRGMKIDEVNTLLGPGKQMSESVGDGGLKTQVYEYLTSDRKVDVTYVDGLVIRYTISSK
jgi:hypothetical protein